MKTRLLFVGWDGADWRYVRPLLQAGKLPHLAWLIKNGANGVLRACLPYATSATWTTILTGTDPCQHGIVTDMEPDGRGDVHPPRSTSRHQPALWNYATRHGLACGIVGFPATVPAEPILGVMVSDQFCEQSTRAGQMWPADETCLSPRDRFQEFCELVVSPEEITGAEIAAIIGDAAPAGGESLIVREVVAELLAQTSTVHNLATHLLEQANCEVVGIRYRFALSLCRCLFGIESRPLKLDEAGEWSQRCVDVAYELLDMMLGRLMEYIDTDTHVILASNHGFNPRPRVIVQAPWEGDLERWKNVPERERKRRLPHEPERHYTPYGMFVANGKKFSGGRLSYSVSQLEILPTMLAVLNISAPKAIDGEPVELPAQLNVQSDSPLLAISDDDGSWPVGYVASPWFTQEFIGRIAEVGAWRSSHPEAAVAIEQAMLRRYHHMGRAHFQAGRFESALRAYYRLSTRDTSFYVKVHLTECLLALGHWHEANQTIVEMETSAPRATVVRALRAHWFSRQGRYEEATAHLSQAIKEQPGVPQLLQQFGCSLVDSKQFDEAIAVFHEVLRLDEQRPPVHAGLAVCYEVLGDVRSAHFHRCRTRELGGSDETRHSLFTEGLI